jgi:hypothetical protein
MPEIRLARFVGAVKSSLMDLQKIWDYPMEQKENYFRRAR